MDTTTTHSPDFRKQDEAGANALKPIESGISASVEMLGQNIVARIATGDKNRAKADEMYKSAGLQLIEARERVPDFKAFLRDHCDGLSRSRAYELIKIADGKTEEVRSNNRVRDLRRREKQGGVRGSRTRVLSAEKPQPLQSQSELALREFKYAVDIRFPQMDAAGKRDAVAYVLGKSGVALS
jgi:hypothetical protein